MTAETLPAISAPAAMSPAEYGVLKEQARTIVESGLAPKSVDTPEKVLVIAMKGRELGVPPMQALSHIHVIEGRPTMSAEMMIALVQRAGHRLRVVETTAKKCVVEGIRRDDPEHKSRLEFTIEEAHSAGVAKKQAWRSYPAAMLRARAISALCRFAFADVLAGVSYVPEELGADVDEEGRVVDVEHEVRGEVQAVEGSSEPEISGEHRGVLEEVEELLSRMPEGAISDPDVAREYARRDLQHALVSRRRLARILDQLQSEELPATKKQLDYLETLINDVVEDGVAKFEEMVGKKLDELSREEASEWIGRLSGRRA